MENFRTMTSIVETYQQNDVERCMTQIEGLWVASIQQNKESFISKFKIGMIVNQLLQNKEKGDGMIEAIAASLTTKLGYLIKPHRLYEMARVVRVFNSDLTKFEVFLDHVLHLGISWNFIVKKCIPQDLTDFASDKDKQCYIEDIKDSAESVVKAVEDTNARMNNVVNSEHFEEKHKKAVKETASSVNHAVNGIVFSALKKPLSDISKRLKDIMNTIQSAESFISEDKEVDELLKVINQLEEVLIALKGVIKKNA